MTFLKPYTPLLLSLMRVICGLAFLQYGMSKFFGFPQSGLAGVELDSFEGWSGLVELVCGGLLVAGLYTRTAALGAFGFIALGYLLVHAPHGGVPSLKGDELAIVSGMCFLYLAAAGGGPVSIDRLFGES
ncbi:DoxX family protein [Roseibium aestuarii]|uniref:DoxX family protein n=1 Tax=Roseibium aestuarii TaxID=2600299 RepID=A0ABW4JY50_9HYPH|nr:DoxX family protein [Roseibium aestuarii]